MEFRAVWVLVINALVAMLIRSRIATVRLSLMPVAVVVQPKPLPRL